MSEDTPEHPAAPPDDGRHAEEPIAGMRELQHETSASFVSVVRQKIYRKQTLSQFVSFSWQMPKTVLVELGSILAHVLNTFNVRKGE